MVSTFNHFSGVHFCSLVQSITVSALPRFDRIPNTQQFVLCFNEIVHTGAGSLCGSIDLK